MVAGAIGRHFGLVYQPYLNDLIALAGIHDEVDQQRDHAQQKPDDQHRDAELLAFDERHRPVALVRDREARRDQPRDLQLHLLGFGDIDVPYAGHKAFSFSCPCIVSPRVSAAATIAADLPAFPLRSSATSWIFALKAEPAGRRPVHDARRRQNDRPVHHARPTDGLTALARPPLRSPRRCRLAVGLAPRMPHGLPIVIIF